MYIKNQSLKLPLLYSLKALLFFAFWSAIIVIGFLHFNYKWLTIPFLPISLIGTALSFYLGFKTNASYDRIWEARKIWGGIVNDSRAFATMLNSYLDEKMDAEKIQSIKVELIRRHIAWLYAHKFYLRHKKQPWEHRKKFNDEYREIFQNEFEIATKLDANLLQYLSKEEVEKVMVLANPAAQILNNQVKRLNELHNEGIIELFRSIEFQNHITKLLEHQGKNERIKNFPYPRQYAMMVRVSVKIFLVLLPFGLLAEMSKQGDLFVWLTIPFSTLVSWIFYYMDVTSEASENPFEGLIYDVPITSITRSIEIDMLQMIGILDTPKPITAKSNILM